jgi:hypothetical protein
MAMWRMTDDGPQPLSTAMLDAESRLEDLVVSDPSLVGLEVLVLGRQVQTDHGGFVDVLAVDVDGAVHVLELKRDRTPRDVIAQALDYGSWVDGLGVAVLEAIYSRHNDGRTLAEDFAERFGQAIPDTLNDVHQMTVVASSLDPASDRIIEYLADRHGVPINAVFFRYFADGDREYLARTWLIDPADVSAGSSISTAATKKRPWNGRDFYTVQGTSESGVERWDLARRFGIITAGGGSWYWKPLRNLKPGHRVFAYVGGAGYVGVGQVAGTVTPAAEAEVIDPDTGEAVQLATRQDLYPSFAERLKSTDPEVTEYVVRVDWTEARDVADAARETGLFASQIPVCKLRDPHTLSFLAAEFGLDDDSPTPT